MEITLNDQKATILRVMENKSSLRSQIWHLEGTDYIITENNYQTDEMVKLNWKTLESTTFMKEKYNLPNRSQIQSIQDGEWWSHTKEERIILQNNEDNRQIQLNQFSSDLITLHHSDNNTLMAGNNSGELHIIHYKDRIDSFYPFTYFANPSELTEFSLPYDKEIFGIGHVKDDWYYGITLTHEGPSKLHLFNSKTNIQRTIGFDESYYLCHVLDGSEDNSLALMFSNPCDHANGGGFINQVDEYGFGIAHIPFPTSSIDNLDVDITSFEYKLKDSILLSQRMFFQNERIYSDQDCLHFVNLNEIPPLPSSQCSDEKGDPYQKMTHSPDEKLLALYNDSGRVAIWDQQKNSNFTSLEILHGLHRCGDSEYQ